MGREANTWEPCGCDWQGKKQPQHKAKPQQNKQTAGKGSQHSKGTSTERCVKHNSRRKNKPADPELTPNSSLKDSSPPKLCPELPGLFCVAQTLGELGQPGQQLASPAGPALRALTNALAAGEQSASRLSHLAGLQLCGQLMLINTSSLSERCC